jgi:hypothetical protein
MKNIDRRVRLTGGLLVCSPGREKQGETYTSNGICQERQITGFLSAAEQKRRKFFPKPPGTD